MRKIILLGLLIVLSSVLPARADECVVLLHGLARSASAMEKMEQSLTAAGYVVVNVDYPSREYNIETLAPLAIPPAVESCIKKNAAPIHFVTHSMGGILLRHYLSTQTIAQLGRVVMMGPPNQGSQVVDNLKSVPGFSAFNGPAGMQLGTSENDLPRQLGAVDFTLGVIAGTRSINWILSSFLPNPDDGKVALENTKVEGMCGFISLPVSHPFLMKNKTVITQTIEFLQHGKFSGEKAQDLCDSKNDNSGVEVFTFENATVKLQVTPDIGGRILSVQLHGHENFLLLGDAVQKIPKPEVTAQTYHIPYMGHETWVSPQSVWWTKQTENKRRFDEKSVWPPDPYLVLSQYQVLEKTASTLVLQGPPSAISGVEMRKSFSFDEASGRIDLVAEIKNIRTEPVEWGVWFNTRVHQDTQVYLPVVGEENVRVNNILSTAAAPIDYHLSDGILSIDLSPPTAGKTTKHGKIFVQPSAGWMAGFRAGQLFIISFPLQPREAIHPEQGQLELYHDYRPTSPAEGVLEMELHGPYRKLEPGETVASTETWTLVAYSGDNTREAHLSFLYKQLKRLALIE